MNLIHEVYGAWNLLREMGFKSDDLFVQVYHGHVCLTLHLDQDTSVEKTFRISCGPLGGMPEETLYALWGKWAEDLSSGKIKDGELLRIYEESTARKNTIPLLMRLVERGLYKPGMTDGDDGAGVPGDVHGRRGAPRTSDDGGC